MQENKDKTENIFSENNIPDINQRVKSMVDYYAAGSVKKFSEMICLSSSQKLNRIFNIDKRNGEYPEVSSDILLSIANMFSEVDLKWLLTGKGDMIKKKSVAPIAYMSKNPTEGIPLIPVSAMAGAFAGEIQVLEIECDRYVIPSFKGADFLITAKGNSMSPTYDSGDMVACKKLSLNNLFFQWNKVYVIDTEQGILIKRIRPGKDDEHIQIVSDNPDYPPFQLSRNQIYHIALVIGVIRVE